MYLSFLDPREVLPNPIDDLIEIHNLRPAVEMLSLECRRMEKSKMPMLIHLLQNF